MDLIAILLKKLRRDSGGVLAIVVGIFAFVGAVAHANAARDGAPTTAPFALLDCLSVVIATVNCALFWRLRSGLRAETSPLPSPSIPPSFKSKVVVEGDAGRDLGFDLNRAITVNELAVVYQPLMAADGRRMRGVEALVRWHHPVHGLILPEVFIPLAEAAGSVVALGEWVLRRACQDARRWPSLRVAVNLSPIQLRQAGFLQSVADILADTSFDPDRLDFELTESVLIQDEEQAETIIMDLRALGIRMGLDDFGSGYSSMIYLRRFAFDKIKIDRSFLQSMEASGEGAIILETIIKLGHALGLIVTAEGVESEEQVTFLQRLGCDELQGYFFAPPLTSDEIDARVSEANWSTPVLPVRDAA